MSGGVDRGLAAVPGLGVGHVSLGDTGCTVVVAPAGAFAAVDVRGGGPGTRETDLLEAHNTVAQVHAVLLSGGSAYGLAAADGVMQHLEGAGIGFPVLGPDRPGPIVPIVPGAVIFDLLVGDPQHRPTAADGAAATRAALAAVDDAAAATARGSVGAGCGATAGKLRGGFGTASATVDTPMGQFTLAAGVVANPVGHVVDPDTGILYGDPRLRVDVDAYAALESLATKLNTTIGVVATDAPVTKAQARRLALTGHDGMARAIRPAHSPLDGDTLFALSTGDGSGVDVETLGMLCAASADTVQAAIVDAVVSAVTGHDTTALSDLLLD
ncbi:peptidase [Corynebacterium sp. 13CS0277]|uniref:P1 family peptidase n=1 Tax=Corynebacterium sp. 13CS0277 TaxID=2071994 RepID=UPI000D042CBA|nr:P1 family peptidase [Corynebacterium sp. 13CS0277]PRQ10842.1 peptidase [Corynebacterium sp. 13CS0277]